MRFQWTQGRSGKAGGGGGEFAGARAPREAGESPAARPQRCDAGHLDNSDLDRLQEVLLEWKFHLWKTLSSVFCKGYEPSPDESQKPKQSQTNCTL